MISLFPTFLAWNQLSPFLIRVTLGLIFVYWSYKGLQKPLSTAQAKTASTIEGLAGILLVIGFWSQLAALVIGLDLLVRLTDRIMRKSFLTDGVNYYLILLVLAISILVTGAGWFAFDLAI